MRGLSMIFPRVGEIDRMFHQLHAGILLQSSTAITKNKVPTSFALTYRAALLMYRRY